MNDVQEFIKLSKILTGFSTEIKDPLASEYYERLKQEYATELNVLLTGFAALNTDSLSQAQKQKKVKENLLVPNFDMILQIINIWYTSRFVNKAKAPKDGKVHQHKGALMWGLLQAPPRAFSEPPSFGKYGYWKAKP
jgi:hypothetical protein